MKSEFFRSVTLVAAWLLAAAAATNVLAQTTNVYVDPSKTWIGYMNVFDLNMNYQFGSAWGTADLRAYMTPGGVVTLAPNTNVYNPSDAYWVNPDGSGAKNMDANFYVQDDTLAGQTITFSGYLWTNSLVTPYLTNVTAFIKDFNGSYQLLGITTTNLTNNGSFSITLPTGAGDHIQYGFEMLGPDANPATAASLGTVLLASNPPPAGPAITGLPAKVYVNVTSNTSITVSATGNNLSYQWKKNGVNLSNGGSVSGATSPTLALANVTGAAEATYTIVVTDNLNRSASGNSIVVVFDPNNLSFDPNATLNGFINAFNVNPDGSVGGYATGFGYPPSLLRGSISNGVAVQQPNTTLYNINDAFWTNPDGTPNKFVEQDYFIANDALAGLTLTFVGYCPFNNLDPSYTASAWIEDFTPSYNGFISANTNLVAGQPFSITLPTTAGDHIQYGLRLFGLDNAPTNTLTQASALVSVPLPVLAVSRNGNTTTLSVPTVAGHSYQLQFKNGITDSSWQNVGAAFPGTGSPQTVTDTTTQAKRYYRVRVN
ncbi:MAG: hypothetical protein C5B50_18025 [Verrucomicrobia bacterium]|nr:MAG: hypothetical protein C5B50_18025 [Verrucomicrobiota bacterium]